MNNEITNKVILVTGGAQGLGKAIAETLAKAKGKIIIGDLQEEKAEQTASELRSQGFEVKSKNLNISKWPSIDETISEIVKEYGTIDVLINNAGIDVSKSVDEISTDEFYRVIDVNLFGTFMITKRVIELMYKNKSGQIINIASTAAKRAWPNASAYHASKWGLLGFTRALYTEARDKNVKVGAVIAGGMKTPFILDRFPDVDPNTLQDPLNVAKTILFMLTLPIETIIPEVMVLPMMETSWP